ncbi:MAG: cytochrome P450 [Ketobacter sp.]|nr:cytochrome P450 [Planctomycetota bacterium]MCP5015803.1 cytochrome P450 [Ketobacter sp.]
MDVVATKYVRKKPKLSVLAPENLSDPYPYFRYLHESAPVYYDSSSQAWVVAKYEYIASMLKDDRMSVNRYDAICLELSDLHKEMNQSIRKSLSNFLLNIDDPKHARLRRLTKDIFLESSVSQMRGDIQAIANELISIQQVGYQFDIVSDYAYPLPIRAICRILGLAEYDLEEIKQLSDDVSVYIGSAGRAPNCVPITFEALKRLNDIFLPIVYARREDPQNDLISKMVSLRSTNDVLDDDEVVANCVLFLVAGFETVTNLIACGVLALLENKEELAKLIQDPTLIGGVIDESLRYYPPVNRTARLCKQDMEVGHHVIKKGEIVILLLGAANRDPNCFASPDNFNINRVSKAKVLSFGSGPHHCIGHLLARLEGEIGIQTLLRHLATHFDFKSYLSEWRGDSKFRGLQSLRLKPLSDQ